MAPEGTTTINEANNTMATKVGEREPTAPSEIGENAQPVGVIRNDNAGTANVAADIAATDASSENKPAATTYPAAASTTSAPPAPPASPAVPHSKTTSVTPTRSGFFSRMGSIAIPAPGVLGDVYDRAQKKAVQLREQADAEVKRLRQQQQQAQAQQQAQQEGQAEFVIPPATGTLIVGSPIQIQSADGCLTSKEVERDLEHAENSGNDADKKESVDGCGESIASQATVPTNNKHKDQPTAAKTTIHSISNAIKIVRDADSDGKVVDYLSPNLSNEYYSSCSHDDDDDDAVHEDNAVVDADNGNVHAGAKRVGKDDVPNKNHVRTENNNNGANSRTASPTPPATAVTLTPNRFSAYTSSVVNAVERYRKLKTSSSFDSVQLFQPQNEPEVLVGGADRVGGLRHFQLDGIIDNNGSQQLPPTMPFRAKTKTVAEAVSKDGAAKLDDSYPFVRSNSRASSANNDAASTAASETTASEDGLPMFPPSTSNSVAHSSSSTATGGKPPSAKNGGRRTSFYEDAVRSVLQPGQRALFFGKGTMGVVLKPTYLASWRGKDGCGLLSATTVAKRGGVFIDSLVPGGHAEKSGVVFVGDCVVRIGAVNVEHMTLEDVVSVILETKRPNIMVLSSEHEAEFVYEDSDSSGGDGMEGKKSFVSPLDLAFGFVNKLAAEEGKELEIHEKAEQDIGHGMTPAIGRNSLLDKDDDGEDVLSPEKEDEEEVMFKSPGKDFTAADYDDDGSNKPDAELQSNSMKPSPYDIAYLLEYASHRTNAHGSKDVEKRHKISLLLKRAALINSDVRTALCLSLSECCKDPRRHSFLEHFFQHNYRSKKETEAKKDRNGRGAKADDNDVTTSVNQNRLLNLYVEMCKFHDAVMVCSVADREKLLHYARKISGLFLSEDGASTDESSNNRLPEYVAHVALGGTVEVQAVRFALRDEDEFFEGGNGGDGFHSIRSSLEAFLSTQESYLSFLISDDCARMRAYLRGSSQFLSVQPHAFLKPSASDSTHHNFLLHAILHLICMKGKDEDGKYDKEKFIVNDALLLNRGKRNMGAASLLSCSIFIMRSLQKSMMAAVEGLIEDGMAGTGNNLQIYSALIEDLQFFWEVYIAPAGGSLSSLALSQDAQDSLNDVRRLIVLSVDEVLPQGKTADDTIPVVALAKKLSSAEVLNSVYGLAEALFREYTLKIYPNFQRHIFHDWACKEARERCYNVKDQTTAIGEYLIPSEYNGLSYGWMNRFLRQMEFPDGMSLHRPSPSQSTTISDTPNLDVPVHLHNGDVALVFGSETGDNAANQIRRFSCVSVQPDTDGPSKKVLFPDDVPPIFESYAAVPPFHERPFQGMLKDEKNSRTSIDGWEVSLTNFVIPSQGMGDSVDDKWMYCVSLVFRKSSNTMPQISEQEINNECLSELQHDESLGGTEYFKSPLFFTESQDGRSRKMKVSLELNEFNRKLQEYKWSQQFGQGATIGLALISSRNVTQAMRETLSLLFKDFCAIKSSTEGLKTPCQMCQPLVDILGVLSHSQVEKSSLGCLLQPYLAYTTSKWVHRPLSDQSDIFLESAGIQLMQALPPVPLALAFVTLLLEQKVVFSSSRRGVLMAASFAIMQLLKPLKWAHLQVPLVPASMMNELIHYPAPFVLGIPTDEKESAGVLSTLPSDVTLIDLDVGRVILASEFVNASKSDGEESDEAAAGALRSQVLFLAECLGGAFGAAMYQNSWCSDSPLQVIPNERDALVEQRRSEGNFSEVLAICDEFISELVSGIHPCCLWIEEKHDDEINKRNEPAIIFDENRFFHIKNLRAEGRYLPLIHKSDQTRSDKFSLSLDNFDLIFETLLRTQCLSTYISGGNKESMLFW